MVLRRRYLLFEFLLAGYKAPEQWSEDADEKLTRAVDVYAFALLAVELVTGTSFSSMCISQLWMCRCTVMGPGCHGTRQASLSLQTRPSAQRADVLGQ
jgi:hypothetical protein